MFGASNIDYDRTNMNIVDAEWTTVTQMTGNTNRPKGKKKKGKINDLQDSDEDPDSPQRGMNKSSSKESLVDKKSGKLTAAGKKALAKKEEEKKLKDQKKKEKADAMKKKEEKEEDLKKRKVEEAKALQEFEKQTKRELKEARENQIVVGAVSRISLKGLLSGVFLESFISVVDSSKDVDEQVEVQTEEEEKEEKDTPYKAAMKILFSRNPESVIDKLIFNPLGLGAGFVPAFGDEKVREDSGPYFNALFGQFLDKNMTTKKAASTKENEDADENEENDEEEESSKIKDFRAADQILSVRSYKSFFNNISLSFPFKLADKLKTSKKFKGSKGGNIDALVSIDASFLNEDRMKVNLVLSFRYFMNFVLILLVLLNKFVYSSDYAFEEKHTSSRPYYARRGEREKIMAEMNSRWFTTGNILFFFVLAQTGFLAYLVYNRYSKSKNTEIVKTEDRGAIIDNVYSLPAKFILSLKALNVCMWAAFLYALFDTLALVKLILAGVYVFYLICARHNADGGIKKSSPSDENSASNTNRAAGPVAQKRGGGAKKKKK